MSRSDRWKRIAATASGGLLILFAAGILFDAGRRFLEGSDPHGPLMIGMALIAAAVNLAGVILQRRIQDPDVSVRAAGTFSLNDSGADLGILVAGALLAWLGSNWPDLVLGEQ